MSLLAMLFILYKATSCGEDVFYFSVHCLIFVNFGLNFVWKYSAVYKLFYFW